MPTTLRIALLAGLLALVSNLAVIGFIYARTHDEAVASLRRQVTEQSQVLTDVYRTGGKTALDQAIDDTLSYADPQTAVALVAPDGREVKGNLAAAPDPQSLQEGYRNAIIRLRGQPSPHQAQLVISRLAGGEWLVSGRLVGEGLAFRATLERSLLLSLVVAGLLGLFCGVVLAHYVSRRIGNIAAVANRISARDLSQRVPLSGAGDSFDRLGMQINAMLDRISALMEELRLLRIRSRTTSARRRAVFAPLPTRRRSRTIRPNRRSYSAASSATPMPSSGSWPRCWRSAGPRHSPAATSSPGLMSANWLRSSPRCTTRSPTSAAALSVSTDQTGRRLFGHRQLLAQALSNLLENAIRYGSGAGEIAVRVQPGEKQIGVEVADRGPGIPLDRREEALRRFGRLNSSRSDEGAGLGLALAQSIAHLHDGELLLEDNKPGLLTTLRLPVHPPQKPR